MCAETFKSPKTACKRRVRTDRLVIEKGVGEGGLDGCQTKEQKTHSDDDDDDDYVRLNALGCRAEIFTIRDKL